VICFTGHDMARSKVKVALRVGPLPPELTSTPSGEQATGHVSVLMFTTGGNRFSIGVEQTEGVVDCPRVSPLPNPPDGIVGVTSVRGRMTLVMDLSLASSQPASKRRLILVKGDAQLGLLADHVEGVLALDPKHLRATAANAGAASSARGAEATWPAKFFFKNEGDAVPVIDIERLSE